MLFQYSKTTSSPNFLGIFGLSSWINSRLTWKLGVDKELFFFLNVKHNLVLTSTAGPCDETLKQSQGGILIGLYLATAYVTFSSMFVSLSDNLDQDVIERDGKNAWNDTFRFFLD